MYFDFDKAFDTIPHEHLLNKLQGYGIQGKVWGWIRNNLQSRQRVALNGAKSNWSLVSSGVPKDVIGLVPFIIFINALPELSQSIAQMFTDDTKVFRSMD